MAEGPNLNIQGRSIILLNLSINLVHWYISGPLEIYLFAIIIEKPDRIDINVIRLV